MRVVIQLLSSLHQALPPWAFALFLVVTGIVGAKPFYRSILARQIGRAVARVARATTQAERLAAEDDALKLAGQDTGLIAAVGDAAVRYNQPLLGRRVIEILDRMGDTKDVLRLRRAMIPEGPKKSGHPIEIAVAVQRLLDGGLYDAAKSRLDDGLERFPEDPDLLALREKLPPVG